MKPTRCALRVGATLLCAAPLAAWAQDAKTPQAAAARKPAASVDEVRKALGEAINAAKAIEKPDANPGELNFRSFSQRLGEEGKVRLLKTLGEAQRKIGDGDAATKTWDEAGDVASEIAEMDDRSRALSQIAEAQAQAGDKAAALATARLAAQAARRIREGSPLPFTPPGEAGADTKKAVALARVAGVQAKAGDPKAAREMFSQAADAAAAVKNTLQRVDALVEIARAEAPADAPAAWDRALAFARSQADALARGRAVEAVLRGRVKAGSPGDAVTTAERLEGDLKAFAFWVVGDEVAKAEAAPGRDLTSRLAKLAEGANYETYSKQSKVFTRVAEAQARAGDASGAEHTLGLLDADTALRRGGFLQARVKLLGEIAEAQIKAGVKREARESLGVALELITPLEEDWQTAFRLDVLARLLAEAGDIPEALALAKKIPGASERTSGLAAVATVQAETGDRAAAKTTLAEADNAVEAISADVLWLQDRGESSLNFETGPKLQGARVVAVARAKAGDLAGAMAAVRTIQADPSFPARVEGSQALADLVAVQIKAGDFAGALATLATPSPNPLQQFDTIGDDKKSEAFRLIAKGQAEAGDAPGVLTWALKQTLAKPKAAALQGMAEGILASKRANKE